MNVNSCLVVAVLLATTAFTEGQDCVGYLVISDSRRSTKQMFNAETDSPISDNDIDQSRWYRFKSYVGNSIPERAEGESVELNHCGTVYPMYISGLNQHPTQDNEVKTATVIVTDWQGQITIYQCPPDEDGDSFYIYSLVPAPADQTAYCAGEGQPCPEGFMFNGYECVDYFPIMKGPPIFSGPHTTGSNEEQQLYFTCHVQYDRVPDETFARFLVTFIFDGLELEDIGAPFNRLLSLVLGPEDDMSVNLTESYLRGRLGKEIQCKVQSFWEENSEKGLAMASAEKYKATLEAVEVFNFDFLHGEEQRIPFTPTLPFTYYHCSAYSCPLPFVYHFFVKTDVANDIDCSLNWGNGFVPELVVQIKPFAGSRVFEVYFEPYDGDYFQGSSSLWHNFTIPTVTIRAFQSSEKWCYSLRDAEITTFDGLFFHASYNGDYYLLHGEVNQYELEVQVRHEACASGLLTQVCNCGVIVRELNSVVKVGYVECGQFDNTTVRPIEVTRLLTQYPDDGTEITRDDTGRKFSVRMPSGTRVEIDATVPWFNVHVNLAPIYHGQTSLYSLCGNSNGFIEDDLNYSNESRITDPAKSYFNVQPECYEGYFPSAKACSCADTGTAVECSNVEQNITTKSSLNRKTTFNMNCVAPNVAANPEVNLQGIMKTLSNADTSKALDIASTSLEKNNGSYSRAELPVENRH